MSSRGLRAVEPIDPLLEERFGTLEQWCSEWHANPVTNIPTETKHNIVANNPASCDDNPAACRRRRAILNFNLLGNDQIHPYLRREETYHP